LREDNPGVRIPPPFIFLSFFLIGVILQRWMPYAFVSVPLGIFFLAAAIAIMGWGFATMLRARTAIIPDKPASQLVSSGPFRFTRNPLYVAMILGYLSASVWVGSTPSLLLLPVAILVLQKFVIAREEAYLSRRFGDEYVAYKRRVRRWV
jgi:protein-S-isoprenylcysteine O-methyltransferase Ste14